MAKFLHVFELGDVEKFSEVCLWKGANFVGNKRFNKECFNHESILTTNGFVFFQIGGHCA